MDQHFTNNAQAVYLASLTQGKKIVFLQKQLSNSEFYTRNLEQDLQATKLTINRLIKQRTNNQVLAKMSENLHRMQRRCRQTQQLLKQNNAKLLIQMQLRIQQKAEYLQKSKQLQQQIDLIRKTNKDKEQQFAIVVNKLRKYQQIRQFTLQQKLNKETKKRMPIKEQDKDLMIKQLSQQLHYYKISTQKAKADIDKKLAILQFALQSQKSYLQLKQEYMCQLDKRKKRESQVITKERMEKKKKIQVDEVCPSKVNINHMNLNQNTNQLIKQLKKLVISNKILEAGMNEATQKNRQLVIINRILAETNIELRNEISQYQKKQYTSINRKASINSQINDGLLTRRLSQVNKHQMMSSIIDKNSRDNFGIRQATDDIYIGKRVNADTPQLIRQRKLKQYFQKLKSKEYKVNIQSIYKDVHRMSQFLILSLGSKAKDALLDVKRQSYSNIIQKNKTKKIREVRSISQGIKEADRNEQQDQNDNHHRYVLSLKIQDQVKQTESNIIDNNGKAISDSYELKNNEEQMYIQQY